MENDYYYDDYYDEDEKNQVELNTIISFLKSYMTLLEDYNEENCGPGCLIRTFQFTNTMANLKIVISKKIRNNLSAHLIRVYHEVSPNVRQEFRPKSRAKKPEMIYRSRNPKEIKKIDELIKEIYFLKEI